MQEWLIVSFASLFAGFVDSIVGGGGLVLLPTLFAVYPLASPATISGTNKMPDFLRDYFLYLKTSVSLTTRFAYLSDIHFFLNYLIIDSEYPSIKDIPISVLNEFSAKDFNYFIAEYFSRYETTRNGQRIIYENSNTTLLRKKSALLSMFKFLFRNGQIDINISDGTNPIKGPKKNPDAIKKLEIFEAERLIHVVSTGEGLTKKEFEYWKHTRQRDLLIVLFFVIYGLRACPLRARGGCRCSGP